MKNNYRLYIDGELAGEYPSRKHACALAFERWLEDPSITFAVKLYDGYSAMSVGLCSDDLEVREDFTVDYTPNLERGESPQLGTVIVDDAAFVVSSSGSTVTVTVYGRTLHACRSLFAYIYHRRHYLGRAAESDGTPASTEWVVALDDYNALAATLEDAMAIADDNVNYYTGFVPCIYEASLCDYDDGELRTTEYTQPEWEGVFDTEARLPHWRWGRDWEGFTWWNDDAPTNEECDEE